jgi:HTH-type transcriptional regulator/antitoxin HipB
MNYSVKTISQLGNSLKSIRQTLGLTQTEAAQRVGLLQKTISTLELGSEKSTIGSFLKLLSALDCDLIIAQKESKG